MTLQELYDKVMASEELKKSFAEAAQDKEKLEAWLKTNGSNATVEQIGEFLKTKQKSGEISDDELENVAGGLSSGKMTASCLTIGLGCALYSAVNQAIENALNACFE